MLSFPGVQWLIGEARSIADLRSGSEIVAELARAAASSAAATAVPVIPQAIDVAAVPNRVVLLARSGTGPDVAREAAVAAPTRNGCSP